MRGVNKVIILGNLGNDPEIRYSATGAAIANLSVATSEQWKDKQTGQKQEKTEWHRVVIFGKLAEIAGEYLRKGSQVYLEGKLQTRKWQNQQGQDQYTTEIVVDINGVMQLLGGGQGQAPQQSQGQAPRQTNQPNQPGYVPHNQQPAQQRPQYAGNGQPQVSPPQNPQPAFDEEDSILF